MTAAAKRTLASPPARLRWRHGTARTRHSGHITENPQGHAPHGRVKRSRQRLPLCSVRGPAGKRRGFSPEESPENKTGIVRCDLIDCANNFKEIATMPARSLCQNFLNNILAPLHLYRQKSLIDATNAVINGASLTLTSIGRHLTGTASVKKNKAGGSTVGESTFAK